MSPVARGAAAVELPLKDATNWFKSLEGQCSLHQPPSDCVEQTLHLAQWTYNLEASPVAAAANPLASMPA
jgi:hypothetical protein